MKIVYYPKNFPFRECFTDNVIRFFIDDFIFEKEIPAKITTQNPLSNLDCHESGIPIPFIYLREAYFFSILDEKDILDYKFQSYFIMRHDLLKDILLKLRSIESLIDNLKKKQVFKDKLDFLKDVIRYTFRCLYFKLFEVIRFTEFNTDKGEFVLKDYLNSYNYCVNILEKKEYVYGVDLMRSNISYFEKSLYGDVFPYQINERYFFFESFVKGNLNNLFIDLFVKHFNAEIESSHKELKKELKNFYYDFFTLLSFDKKYEDIYDDSFVKRWMRFYKECLNEVVKIKG